MNDYVAAYHDTVLLVGQVMRNIRNTSGSSYELLNMEFFNINHFREVSFDGVCFSSRSLLTLILNAGFRMFMEQYK